MDDHKDMMTASLKTLPVKPSGIKPGQRKKECSILTFYEDAPPHDDHKDMVTASLKTLSVKPSGTKPRQRKKRV